MTKDDLKKLAKDAKYIPVLDFVTRLEHIKNRVETQFPNARDFIRPGFDDIMHSA